MNVLACPHCDRSFQVTPAAVGKKIRCRQCRGIFHVPSTGNGVPPELPQDVSSRVDSPRPLAIHRIVDGHDACSCPECGHTFRMNDVFAGKTIRCRGCRITFRVGTSERTRVEPTQIEIVQTQPEAAVARPTPPQTAVIGPSTRPPLAPLSPVTIPEDAGDVVDDVSPEERIDSAAPPRHPGRSSSPQGNPVAFMVAIVLGGVCAIPATLTILRFVSPEQFENVAAMLPEFLVGWLR